MWQVEYIKEAVEDLKRLDYSQRLLVLKAIDKVSNNPLPQTEGGYGKPLGNRNNTRLARHLKIKLKKPGLRVVYKLVRENEVMRIVVISVRADNEAYLIARRRTRTDK
ncbi:type II toxin-antitoxin system RelE/ParE family toxin [Desulfoscipio sp. XC116]|uniref:type II toxin-antitoxin system RelE family toxin n=1 Tax=Desulfoscipio sp. XC116 TaxID=3144975 RepID=UPI00325C2A25